MYCTVLFDRVAYLHYYQHYYYPFYTQYRTIRYSRVSYHLFYSLYCTILYSIIPEEKFRTKMARPSGISSIGFDVADITNAPVVVE